MWEMQVNLLNIWVALKNQKDNINPQSHNRLRFKQVIHIKKGFLKSQETYEKLLKLTGNLKGLINTS